VDVPANPLAPRIPGRKRLLVANLDAELSWAKTLRGVHTVLPRRVATASAAAAAAMAVLGEPGDLLWLPEPIDPERFASLAERTGVELTWAPLHELSGMDELVPWGYTESVEALVGSSTMSAALVAELNDRCTSLDMERALGVEIPGCARIASQAELDEALRRWPHPAPWVLKAPLSASGRSRLRRRGPPESDARTRARRLLDGSKVLVLEPWLERTDDWGTVAAVTDAGTTVWPSHRLVVDGNGVFRAACTADAFAPELLSSVVSRVGALLGARGYRGPFGIDAFRYRADDGLALRPLCEINARLSFGHLAQAAARRWADELGPSAPRTCLGISRGEPLPDDAVVLVGPDTGDPTTVYLSASCLAKTAGSDVGSLH